MIVPTKKNCAISSQLVQPLKITKLWNDPTSQSYNLVFQFLSTVLVKAKGSFYMKERDQWRILDSKDSVMPAVYSVYAGHQLFANANLNITEDSIKHYLRYGLLVLDNVTYAPLCPDFVTFNNQSCLNTYVDRRIDGDDAFVADLEPVLQMIRNGLCSAPDILSLPDMLDELGSDQPTAFRWTMNYIANRFQRPGSHLQTNLHFSGRRGLGKGTLVKCIRNTSNSVSKLEAADIERGWTDSTYAHDWVEADEFKGNGWYDYNNFIKQLTGNETYNVVSRNKGVTLQPAVSSYIFTTNNKRTMFVEEDDRQNTFIETNPDDYWKAHAIKVAQSLNDPIVAERVYKGFSALLTSMNLDIAFVSRPLFTEKRSELVGFFNDSTLDQWLEAIKTGECQLHNARPNWSDLHEIYINWCKIHCGKQQIFSRKEFVKHFEDTGTITSIVKKVGGKSVRYCQIVGMNIAPTDDDNIITLADRI